MNAYPLHHGDSFCPSLLTFHLQITSRKLRKLVEKVLIKLLHHAKSAAYIINDAPTVA